jgi:hypothetical protein
MGAGAEPLRGAHAELDAPLGLGELQLLGVGVGDDELDALQPGLDHVVDRVAASPADSKDHDPRLQFGRLRRRESDRHGTPSEIGLGASANPREAPIVTMR